MPIIFAIPKGYQKGFQQLSEIDAPTYKKIVEGLSYISLKPSITILVESVSEVKGISPDLFDEIFLSVGSLADFLDDGAEIKEIVDDIVKIIKTTDLIDFKNPKQEKEFVTRLTFLLGNQQIYYASKAFDLSTESGSLFLSSKIVSDIRPIFNVSVKEMPKAGIIAHTFHIHYKSCDQSSHKDIYFSLDSNDIDSLIDNLERAKLKEETLRLMFEKTGMININE